MKSIFGKFEGFKKIISIPNSNNIYIKFNSRKGIDDALNSNEKKIKDLNPLEVSKIPLDLN